MIMYFIICLEFVIKEVGLYRIGLKFYDKILHNFKLNAAKQIDVLLSDVDLICLPINKYTFHPVEEILLNTIYKLDRFI